MIKLGGVAGAVKFNRKKDHKEGDQRKDRHMALNRVTRVDINGKGRR